MKVLFFDSWSQSKDYVADLVELLAIDKQQVLLVHSNSIMKLGLDADLVGKLDVKDDFMYRDIRCRDVSSYKKNFYTIFKMENPDVVFMFSISHFANRLVNIVCKQLNIKVVYIQHGVLFDKAEAEKSVHEYKTAFKNRLLLIFKKLRKFIILYINLFLSKNDLFDSISLIFSHLKSPISFIWAPTEHPSLNVDLAFAFSEREKIAIRDTFKMFKTQIEISGNPILGNRVRAFNFEKSNILSSSLGEYAVFLDQSLTELGLVNQEEQIEFLRKINNTLMKYQIRLIVKIHPKSGLMKTWSDLDFGTVISNEYNLYELLNGARFVLGYNSTALIEALGLNKNIVTFPYFNDFRGLRIFLNDTSLSVNNFGELDVCIRNACLEDKFICQIQKDEYFIQEDESQFITKKLFDLVSSQKNMLGC